VIVTLFGVGLDYDIFLVTRTREEVIKGKNDEDAISEALKENAGVILALGLILAGVFGSLIMSPIAIIKEIGFSITMGVLIDTMVSWLFLIPALMLIMKKYNWWPSKIASGKLRNEK
jgi:RND superfamily putative drug exporter